MKKALTIYIPDDCHLLAICGGIAIEKNDLSDKSVNFSNFRKDLLSETEGVYFKIEGEAEYIKKEDAT